jgi:uncharacterized OsmC-like protein
MLVFYNEIASLASCVPMTIRLVLGKRNAKAIFCFENTIKQHPKT